MSNITYLVRLTNGEEHRFDVDVNRGAPRTKPGEVLPGWTALEVNRCPHCPLPAAPGARCPAAVDLVPTIARFSALTSIERAEVRVLSREREVRKETDLQTALSGLMGLILATSACPILRRLRPLGQTHLPFTSPHETLYRMAAMHLFRCFMRGEPASFDGLQQFLSDLDKLDQAFAERLRFAAMKDASVNALLVLHARAVVASMSLDQGLAQIREWFES